MSVFEAIDLTKFPPPQIVQEIDPEINVALLKADMLIRLTRDNQFTEADARLLLDDESQPIVKALENAAYLAALKRTEFQGKAVGLLLAFAVGAELDHIAATIPLKRRVIVEADPDAEPAIEEVLESDDEFRQRIRFAPHGFSTAGSKGGYEFHAISGSTSIKDAEAWSPSPNHVSVVVLSRFGDGSASEGDLDQVKRALNEEKVRPLGDIVDVTGPTINKFEIDATLTLEPGPDAGNVLENVQAKLLEYGRRQHRLGASIHINKLISILGQEGVENPVLNNLQDDIVGTHTSAPYLENISLRVAP